MAKVVQTELTIGLLVRVQGAPMFISSDFPCILQVVEFKTSECYRQALEAQTSMPFMEELVAEFPHVFHCGVTDRDAANLRLLKAMAYASYDFRIYMPCQVVEENYATSPSATRPEPHTS